MANDTEKTKRFEEEARPNAGTNTLDRKAAPEGQSGESAFKYRFSTTNEVKDATQDIDAAKECLNAQLGRGTPDGGKLGNSTTQPQSCVNDCDQ
jgi:hypothetical protein